MELYKKEEIGIFARREKVWTILVSLLMAALLISIITICCLTDQYNGQQMEYTVYAILVPGGWVCIYIWLDVILMYHREKKHTQLILESTPHTAEGTLKVQRMLFSIPQSVTVRKVSLETVEPHTGEVLSQLYSVDVRREKEVTVLNGKSVRITEAHGYIIAIEGGEEA
ncbi:MAG: hypothetical protein HUJ69_08630 [Lachnospiraceae bacterium]|nr:hypothetical protein [Lachnospiraceae bacterium]